ncbi:luciferin sulfotransferase-like [Schistocerca serialis cubense]|uniref:luciferin sulfotransferase-like n=1 Tax=Schistocerca serialis cubense TaxID=2023355 RepID=UPI00214EF7B3|nr:luciferin sulfotransferase-like [Schistocerca serialis cubense]
MSLRAEKLRSPLAVKFVSCVRGPLRDDHVRVRPPGCVMPARYMRDARRILDLEVRPEDVWIVTLPKCAMYLPYWEHVIPFWNMRQEPHVLFFSYEEMKEDLALVVRRTAAFLGKPITEEMVAQLVDHLSFDRMRDNPAVNNSSAVEHIRKEHQLEPAASTGRSFMRRGVVGEGGQRLSEGVQRRLEHWTEQRLQGRGYTGPR